MNFEKYIGQRVRIDTNIIDEYTNKCKIIEGVYEGYDSIGNAHYIIVDGESYPEMCINNWGLVPERNEVVIDKKVEVVEEQYVPAFVLQTDPLDMINAEIDEVGLEDFEYTTKPRLFSWFSGEWIGKATATIIIIIVMIISCASSQHTTYSLMEDVTSIAHTYTPLLSDNSKQCTMTVGGLCCDGEILYVNGKENSSIGCSNYM